MQTLTMFYDVRMKNILHNIVLCHLRVQETLTNGHEVDNNSSCTRIREHNPHSRCRLRLNITNTGFQRRISF